MKRSILTAAITSVLATVVLNSHIAAAADIGNAMKPVNADATFMKQLAVGGLAEVEAGKLASQKAASNEVKSFGKQMVEDHSKANAKLMALAKEKGVELPSKPDADHIAKAENLEKQSGAAFDKEYVSEQVKDHEKTVELLKHEISTGKDDGAKNLATEILPTVQHHLEMVKALQAKVNTGR